MHWRSNRQILSKCSRFMPPLQLLSQTSSSWKSSSRVKDSKLYHELVIKNLCNIPGYFMARSHENAFWHKIAILLYSIHYKTFRAQHNNTKASIQKHNKWCFFKPFLSFQTSKRRIIVQPQLAVLELLFGVLLTRIGRNFLCEITQPIIYVFFRNRFLSPFSVLFLKYKASSEN